MQQVWEKLIFMFYFLDTNKPLATPLDIKAMPLDFVTVDPRDPKYAKVTPSALGLSVI